MADSWKRASASLAPEWDEVDNTVRESLRVVSEDGETWIPFSSFLVEYCRVDICHLNPDYVHSREDLTWCLSEFSGSWTSGSTAGGCTNYRKRSRILESRNPATFWTNPQFWIKLEEPDVDQPENAETPLSTVIVCLMQKHHRRKKIDGGQLLSIGFTIYEAPKEMPPNVHLGHDFFMKYRAVARAGAFINLREVFGRFQLPVGNYVIVPSTFAPFEEADFLLRVYTEKKAQALELGYAVYAAVYEPSVNGKPDTVILYGSEPLDEEKDEYNAEDLRDVLNKLLSKCKNVKSDGFCLKTCKEMIDSLDVSFYKCP
ncbi:calpain-8-like [Engystomops pustulosus]|uniref:calpain-8-like n=1 Tax=Engystomops pustulosus TaxID=76066 RepID=UPI003AFA0A5A